jgi:hypothetical protein
LSGPQIPCEGVLRLNGRAERGDDPCLHHENGNTKKNQRPAASTDIARNSPRGHAKVFCHLMFGVLALTIDQLMRLIT